MVNKETKLLNRRIRDVARQYRKRGYDVVVHPQGDHLPEFLSGFEPDIIAKKDGDSVVIEVKTQARLQGSNEIVSIAEKVAKETGWRFELDVTNPTMGISLAAPVVSELVANVLRNADAISKIGLRDAAVVYVSSAIEALVQELARRLGIASDEDSFSGLLRKMVYRGAIDHELFEELQGLYDERTRIMHQASPGARVSAEDLIRVVEKLKVILSETEIAA
jgi:REase_AHJR-like protein